MDGFYGGHKAAPKQGMKEAEEKFSFPDRGKGSRSIPGSLRRNNREMGIWGGCFDLGLGLKMGFGILEGSQSGEFLECGMGKGELRIQGSGFGNSLPLWEKGWDPIPIPATGVTLDRPKFMEIRFHLGRGSRVKKGIWDACRDP